MTRRLSCLSLSAIFSLFLAVPFASAAETPLTQGAKITWDKKLKVKLNLDIDKKMLQPLLSDDLPAAVKEVTGLTVKIEKAPGSLGITFTSSFGPFKGEMTLEEVINKICDDRGWGWYVNNGKKDDQKDGAIFLTTNPKERGYKEGTGPKEVAKSDPKDKPKDKAKDEPKTADGDKAAAELLSKAKFQINTKQNEKATATLKEIIEKHPDTKAATEAKKLLEKLGK